MVKYSRRIRSPQGLIIRELVRSMPILKIQSVLTMYPITDQEALDALQLLSRTEGIIPALESAHAIAHTLKIAPTMSKDQIIIVSLSGRGDKDVESIMGS